MNFSFQRKECLRMTKCDFCIQSSPKGKCPFVLQSTRENYCKEAIKQMVNALRSYKNDSRRR